MKISIHLYFAMLTLHLRREFMPFGWIDLNDAPTEFIRLSRSKASNDP